MKEIPIGFERDLILEICTKGVCYNARVICNNQCGVDLKVGSHLISCKESFNDIWRLCKCNTTWVNRRSAILKYGLENSIVTNEDLLEHLI